MMYLPFLLSCLLVGVYADQAISTTLTPPTSNCSSSTASEDDPVFTSGCGACKMIKSIMDEEKLKGKQEEDVNDAVERACLGLPYDMRRECASMAVIVQSVPVSSPSIDACGVICYSPRQALSSYASPTTCEETEDVFNGTCNQCKPVMDFMRTRAQKLPTEDIADNLDVMCFEMEASLTPSCITYLTAFEKLIADHITAGASSKQTCQAIGMC